MPYQPYQSTWQNPYLPLTNQGQPVTTMVQPYQQPVNGIVKVNGRDSAMQYQLPPNSTSPALFDNSGSCFYIVTTDGIDCTTGEKTQHECEGFVEAVIDLDSWLGWWNYYKEPRTLAGTEKDFYIECNVHLH